MLPKNKPDNVSPVIWDILACMRAACAQAYIEAKIGTEPFLEMQKTARDSVMDQALGGTEAVAIRALRDILDLVRIYGLKSEDGKEGPLQ